MVKANGQQTLEASDVKMKHANEDTPINPTEPPVTAYLSLGRGLRKVRLVLDLTQTDVELLSREIADREGCPDFVVRNFQLSSIEHGHSLPGPGKLMAPAEIYGLTREQLMKLWATIRRPWWT